MITMQCKGPRGTVVGKAMKDKRAARASAMGTYSSTFGRDALKAAKGKLTFSNVRGNPAPSPAPRPKGKPRSRKAPAPHGTAKKPLGIHPLPFEVPIVALKEGKRMVLGLDARRKPVYIEHARTLTEARAMAASGALPKGVKYRVVIEVSRHPGVYQAS